jgi:hypothetical protein
MSEKEMQTGVGKKKLGLRLRSAANVRYALARLARQVEADAIPAAKAKLLRSCYLAILDAIESEAVEARRDEKIRELEAMIREHGPRAVS